MKTLIIGGAGFLGNYYTKLQNSKPNVWFLQNKKKIETNSDNIIQGSVSDSSVLRELSEKKFNALIDFSWIGLPDLSSQKIKANILLKSRLYESLLESGVESIDTIGSCLEYGELTGQVDEEILGSDISSFGLAKLELLELLQKASVKYRWYRCFYLIGIGQHPKSLIRTAIQSVSQSGEFNPKFSTASFDFISVADGARAISLAIENDIASGVYNIGSGNLKSVNSVVNIVRDFYGVNQEVVLSEPGIFANISKISNATGWEPRISVTDTVQTMIKAYSPR